MKKSIQSVFFVFVLLAVWVSGCAPTSTPAPTPVSPTFTPSSLPPTVTPEPTATATIAPTSTIIPTPTLPFEVSSPAAGTGTVIGIVLWNGEPVVKNLVNLCESYDESSGCYGERYSASSNDQGYYIFENVKPGEYVLRINMFSVGWYHVVDEDGQPHRDPVKADQITILDPLDIYKFDLKTTYPHGSGAVVVYETQPTLTWAEYPSTAYYIVEINKTGWLGVSGCPSGTDGSLVSPKIEDGQTSFKVSPPLEPGNQNLYYWCVIAYNKSGTKIAEGFGDPFYVLNP